MKSLTSLAVLGALGTLASFAYAAPTPTMTAVVPLQQPKINRQQVVKAVPMVTKTAFNPATGRTVTLQAPPSMHHVPLKDIVADPTTAFLRQDPFYCVGTDTCRFGRMPYYNQTNPNFAYLDPNERTQLNELYPVQGTRSTDGQGHDFVSISNSIPAGVADSFMDSWLPYGPFPGDQGALNATNDQGYKYEVSNICGPTAQAMALAALLAAKSPATTILPNQDVANFVTPSTNVQPGLSTPLLVDHQSKAVMPGYIGPPVNPMPGTGWQMSREDLLRVHWMATWQGTDPTWGGRFDYILNLGSKFSPAGHAQTGALVDPNVLIGLFRQKHAIVLSMQFYKTTVTSSTVNGVVKKFITFTHDGGHALAVDGFDGADAGAPKFFVHDPMYGHAYHRSFVKLTNSENSPTLSYTLPENQSELYNMSYEDQLRFHVADITDGERIGFLTAYYALSMQ